LVRLLFEWRNGLQWIDRPSSHLYVITRLVLVVESLIPQTGADRLKQVFGQTLAGTSFDGVYAVGIMIGGTMVYDFSFILTEI
jgi:hypothetical protein